MENKKETRGGRREGAGRKSKDVVNVSVSLLRDNAARIAEMADGSGQSKSAVINMILSRYFTAD